MKKLGEKETLWETGEKESFYVFKNSMEPVAYICLTICISYETTHCTNNEVLYWGLFR